MSEAVAARAQRQVGSLCSLLLTGLAILAVLAIVAAFIFRNSIYEFTLNPRQPFQTAPREMPPDYGEAAAWAALGTLPDGTSGVDLGMGQQAPTADVFFVHGTTYAFADRWNAPLNGAATAHVDGSVLASEAEPFQAAGRLFAPRYRQATLYTFRTRSEDSRRARALAYGDVRQAFRHYVQRHQAGRPFVLAGVGQGGLHVTGLLQDEIADQDVAAHLVAAYVIAHPIPLDLFDDALSAFHPCTGPADSGCVLSWTAYPAGVKARMVTDRSMVWDGRVLTSVATRPILCAVPVADGEAYGINPGPNCQDGIVRVSGLEALLTPPAPYARRPFHSLSANLFQNEVGADMARRTAAMVRITGP